METQGGRRGRPPYPDVLTPAEWHVLEQLRNGLTNAEIAIELGISPDGVKYHISNMLGKLDLPDRHALARWQPPGRFGGHRASTKAVLVLAGLVGSLVLVGVVILLAVRALGRPRPTNDLPDVHSTLKITSFQLTERIVNDVHITLPNGTAIPLPPGGTTDSRTIAFRSPDEVRIDDVGTVNNDGQSEPDAAASLSNGQNEWSWTPGSTDVTQQQQIPASAAAFVDEYPAKGTSLRSLVAKLAPARTAHFGGEGTVAGRPVYIIDLDPRPCPSGTPDTDGPRRLWLDKETLFPLKSDQYSVTGGRLTVSVVVTSIRYNLSLPNSVFQLPANAAVHGGGCGLPTPTPGAGSGNADPCATIRAEETAAAQATAAACATVSTPTALATSPNQSSRS